MKVKNWQKFQHFKDRRPPWIKLYRDILDDPDWHSLDPKSAKILVMLWLIASEDASKDGSLPCVKKLAFRLRVRESELIKSIQDLNDWLIQDDIEMISGRYQDDAPETETEGETETETESLPKGSVSSLPLDAAAPVDSQPVKKEKIPFADIVGYLNEKAGTSFKANNKATISHIKARWNEGFRLEDFMAVIDHKCGEWLTDEKMVQYLRPQTLFTGKFESYLQAAKGNGGRPANGKIRCSDCTYNRGRKCPNLSKEGFDPAKCGAFREAA